MFGTKKKLMAAVVMLVISATMLTSASYAWFTISTNPEITELTAQVVVNETLEIALANTDATAPENWDTDGVAESKQYTWGNIVDLSDANGGDARTALGTRTLRPVTIDDDNTLIYPTYGNDGRISGFDDLTATKRLNGFGNLKDDGGKIYGYYVDFWLRSNVGGKVTLSADNTSRSTSGIAGNGTVFKSTNKVLADNLAIAFAEIDSATAEVTEVKAKAAVPGVTTADPPYSKAFTVTDNVVELTANQAKLVRMYIYLDGENVTNESASIDGTLIAGSLNVQFGISDVNYSMDGQP